MLKTALVLLLIVVGPFVAAAEDKRAAQDLLTSAARQTALLDAAAKPFVMDVDFTAQFDVPRQGHLRLRWEAKDRWWSKLTVGPYEQIWYRNGGKSYLLRNASVSPRQVRELYDLLHVGKDYSKLAAQKAKERAKDGVRMMCVEAEYAEYSAIHEEICIDPATHLIASQTHKAGGNTRISTFTDYADFDGFQYPRRLQLQQGGTTVLTANVMEIKEEPLDAKLLAPIDEAIERRECDDKIPPKPVHPPQVDLNGVSAGSSSAMDVTILADGSVGEISVVQSGGKTMDDAVIYALKHAKFKPAMCGSEPVVADIQMDVNFEQY